MIPPPDNSDPRDYILDLTSSPSPPTAPTADKKFQNSELRIQNSPKSPYLSIHFKCCHVYAPIYRNAAGTAYAGHCPRCRRATSIPIAPGGSTARIFQAE